MLVYERSLWLEHRFATTSVLVLQDYLERCPQQIEQFLAAQVETTRWIGANRAQAATVLNGQIKKRTGKKVKQAVIARAMKNVSSPGIR